MGSGSWRRRGESLEADSFWSLPSYLGTVVLGFCLEGVCAVCCFFYFNIQVFWNHCIFLFNSIRDLLTDHA